MADFLILRFIHYIFQSLLSILHTVSFLPFIIVGCGRFFEGNATDMDSALNEKLGNLPNDTVLHFLLKLNFQK